MAPAKLHWSTNNRYNNDINIVSTTFVHIRFLSTCDKITTIIL